MKLTAEDANLFYRLMYGLHFYTSNQLSILPSIHSVEQYFDSSQADKRRVRDALWKNPHLIDAYLGQNPDALSPDELDIVRSWKRFVPGTFQLFRLLKKHTILIGGKSPAVYGVLGLRNGLEELLGGRPLPVTVEAVLLPFKGKIVCDGMLSLYDIYYGPGLRAALNEGYLAAKQNGRIITTFEPGRAEPTRKSRAKPAKDWRPLLDELVQATESLRGGPAIQSAAFALLRASARMAQAAAQEPDDWDRLDHHELQVRRSLTRLRNTLERAED